MRNRISLFIVLFWISSVNGQIGMDSIRLNDIRIVASHNSYKKKPHPKVLKFLSKFPGIGPKASQQIILDLKGKLIVDFERIILHDNIYNVI